MIERTRVTDTIVATVGKVSVSRLSGHEEIRSNVLNGGWDALAGDVDDLRLLSKAIIEFLSDLNLRGSRA